MATPLSPKTDNMIAAIGPMQQTVGRTAINAERTVTLLDALFFILDDPPFSLRCLEPIIRYVIGESRRMGRVKPSVRAESSLIALAPWVDQTWQ